MQGRNKIHCLKLSSKMLQYICHSVLNKTECTTDYATKAKVKLQDQVTKFPRYYSKTVKVRLRPYTNHVSCSKGIPWRLTPMQLMKHGWVLFSKTLTRPSAPLSGRGLFVISHPKKRHTTSKCFYFKDYESMNCTNK